MKHTSIVCREGTEENNLNEQYLPAEQRDLDITNIMMNGN
jgi:hypothetical protein